MLSTLTAIVCIASLVYFEAVPGQRSAVFGIHALAFVAFGSLWFHLFGRPSLAGWWLGHATEATLERERTAFRNERDATDNRATDNHATDNHATDNHATDNHATG